MKKLLNCDCGERMRELAPFILRLVTGLIFAAHGYQKLTVFGVSGVTNMLTMLNFPAPAFLAVVLIAVELIGGLFLILGVFTHWTAKVLAFVALVAFLTAHLMKGFFISAGGFEFILLILAASISLMITGAGKWSVDYALKSR